MDASNSQQFHLKWNNHSLNTLSSFQHLLDTNSLVDVSLTCSSGKTLMAHRMVLAACSEYFYQLFKDLAEKHPVIVFKDAHEDIVRDLLLFMYKGEVEVQEALLNDFLQFADTLQVKGLSKSERDEASRHQRLLQPNTQQAQSLAAPSFLATDGSNTPPIPPQTSMTKGFDAPAIKSSPRSTVTTTRTTPPVPPCPPSLPEMTKSYLAAAGLAPGKFPPIFPFSGSDAVSAADFLTHLSSPNLYRALHQGKYQSQLTGKLVPETPQENPILKGMSFMNLKKIFDGAAGRGGEVPPIMPPSVAELASMYPRHIGGSGDDNDNDSIGESSSPPLTHQSQTPPVAHQASKTPTSTSSNLVDDNSENNTNEQSLMETDYQTTPVDLNSSGSDQRGASGGGSGGHDSDSSLTTTPTRRGGSAKQPAGRGSRLERMIAAEYKILSEYSEQSQELPVMTPELMKSRRTHSLQLAIGEILHNRASVQSAATKYHIPRETLRRHYQRYLKAMGIQRAPATVSANNNTATIRSSSGAANNNNNVTKQSVTAMDTSASGDESSNGFSSLLDIGQAYGIWNTDLDGPDFKTKLQEEAAKRAASAMSSAFASPGQLEEKDRERRDKELLLDDKGDDLTSRKRARRSKDMEEENPTTAAEVAPIQKNDNDDEEEEEEIEPVALEVDETSSSMPKPASMETMA